jgi:aminoglycoside phosphotransferase (APT) family kinase protein
VQYQESLQTAVAEAAARIERREAHLLALTPKKYDTASSDSIASRVERYFEQRFPGAGRPRAARVVPIPGGRSKSTILVDLKDHGELPESVVIRLDIPDSALGTTVIDEYPLVEHAFRHRIRVPEALWLEADSGYLGSPFMVTRRMPGRAAADTMFDFSGITPELALSLARALASVHALDPVPLWPSTGRQMARDCTADLFAKFEQRWRSASAIRPSVIVECAFAALEDGLNHVIGSSRVVHADPSFQNVLVVDGEVGSLLDWEFAHPGDPAEDLAYVRSPVERVISWSRFMEEYRAHGGVAMSEERLKVFEIWASVRNIVFASSVLVSFENGVRNDIQSAAIAINTFPKLEAQLAQKMIATRTSR